MKQLLVVADKEGTTQLAFHHALEIAKNTGGVIEFVGFVHAPGVDSSDILSHQDKRKIYRSYIEQKEDELLAFLEKTDTADVKIKTDVVWEKSFETWVISRCSQKSFDMVFKSGNRSESFLYTPSDWQLMRHCPESVMIVGDSPWKEGGVILAALDLSSDSPRALQQNEDILKQAIKLARATNCEMHACYSMAIPKVLSDLDLIDPKEYEDKMKDSLDPLIKKLVEDAGLDRDRLHLLVGRPAKAICKISDKVGADVVVLGSKSRTSLRGRLLGNTAESVLNKINADVVVVK